MSSPELRAKQYNDGGQIFAATAVELGFDIPPETAENWSRTMITLSVADSMSEENPHFLDAEGFLAMLGLDTDDQRLQNAAINLIEANLGSMTASSLRQHFSSRSQEALSTADLIRFQSPEEILENDSLWDQLAGLAVVGIHIDSLIDCQEDANRLPQFSSTQLAIGAFGSLIKAARKVQPNTYAACGRAIRDLGLYPQIGQRIIQKVLFEPV